MSSGHNHVTAFEFESLRVDRGEKRISKTQLEALQQYYGEKGVPYFSLIHNGVKFCEYVGVIQIGNTTIEVLPKADKEHTNDQWRELLIGMLKAVGVFNIQAPSSGDLRIVPNSILELYFELFVQEVEYIMHRGLIRKYRKTEGNLSSLKGGIKFPKHLAKNLVHRERFYVNYTIYDREHLIHKILYKALILLNRINISAQLSSRIGTLLLDYPDVPDVKISSGVFDKIQLNRKSECYRNALQIARLILLNHHPDVKRGNNDVLALMFDMNLLWERFIYSSLRKYKSTGTTLHAQSTRSFWKPTSGYRSHIKPDIVINQDKDNCIVLDTKWKNLNGSNPSPDDLRQMFVYLKYYKAKKVALVYPGISSDIKGGNYYKESDESLDNTECSTISISVGKNIMEWQRSINEQLSDWC